MFDLSASFLFIVGSTFFAAGVVKGVTGMGLPTMAMGLMGSLVSPLTAASLLIVPSFVTNVWQLLAGPNFMPLLFRLWAMMLALAVATALGSSWLAAGDNRLTTAALGAALVAYSGYALLARQVGVPRHSERLLSPLIGAATGIVTGATGVLVFPAVPYLQALGLAKEDLVQALGLSFTVSTIALSIGLGAQGVLETEMLGLSVLAVLPALAGMWIGQCIRDRISPAVFRRGFLLCLMLLGAEMCLRALF